jgi:hypothetical protein
LLEYIDLIVKHYSGGRGDWNAGLKDSRVRGFKGEKQRVRGVKGFKAESMGFEGSRADSWLQGWGLTANAEFGIEEFGVSG